MNASTSTRQASGRTAARATGEPRLLVLIDRYRPILGGAQNNIHELSRRLTERGFVVTVLTRRLYRETAPAETDEGVRVRRIAYAGNRLVSKLSFLIQATAHVVRNRGEYDLVMCVPCTKVTDLLPMLVAGPVSGVPYVIRATGMADIFDEVLAWRKGSAAAMLASLLPPPFVWRRIYARARTIVIQSSALREHPDRFGLGTTLIPNGADTARFRPASVEERRRLQEGLRLPQDRVVVITTGRYSAPKNQITLIRAAERVERELAPGRMCLMILGATERGQVTSNEEALKSYVRDNGLEPLIRFHDDVKNVDDYLRASDVYCIPSNSDEGMSNALVEAMACGLPVLSSRIPQNVAVLPADGARFFEPLDVGALAAHLVDVIDSASVRESMGAANRAHVDRNYSNDELAGRYARLIRELTGRDVSHAEGGAR